MFSVGDTVKFVPDPDDALSFPEWNGRVGTVVEVDDLPGVPYPYRIRFHFDNKTWPVKEVELVIFEGVN
jgi:hypothetical protein